MKKTSKTKLSDQKITLSNTSKSVEILCSNCKEVVFFGEGQDSKLCPSCGNLVQNIKHL